MNLIKKVMTSILLAGSCLGMSANDPNFHIYICLGQSNMEGNASIEPIDRKDVPERFRMMAAVDFTDSGRKQGEWYTATPPLVRQNTGLTPMDYFGRTMVDNLPEEVRVGVVCVAIGGCKIEHLDKDFDASTLANEADWFKSFMLNYDNAPYQRLLQCARKAQEAGVIKGVLLHQGESNTGDQQWCVKVKKIYDDLLSDLGMESGSVPLLAGEVVTTEQGGVCGGMNTIINRLPKTLPTAHVVSAGNLPQKGDGLHFTAHGYRVLGCRYAVEMLATMGIMNPDVAYSEEIPYVPKPEPSEGDFVFALDSFNPNIWEKGTFNIETGEFKCGQYGFGGWEYTLPIDLSGYKYIVAELGEQDRDGVEFKVFDTASYWEIPYAYKFNGGTLLVGELAGMMKNLSSGIVPLNTSEIYRVGFWGYGNNPIHVKQVYATNENPYDSGIDAIASDVLMDEAVYDLSGRKVAESIESDTILSPGIYISGGKKMFVKPEI